MSHDTDRTDTPAAGDRWENEKPQPDQQDQERDVDAEPEVDVTSPPPAFDESEADAADVADQYAEVPLDEERPRE